MQFYISRFKDIEKRDFECEVITPMFLGGAEKSSVELRPASIKGSLRFWWRAIYGSNDLVAMKKAEEKIFGSTNKKSIISIHAQFVADFKHEISNLPSGYMIPTVSKGRNFKISIIEYLAYGLYEWDKFKRKNEYTKAHIRPGTKFRVVIKAKGNEACEQVINSLNFLCNYGGLGSRSRNGFGSFDIPDLSMPLKISGELKSFTGLSDKMLLFDKFPQKDTWEAALSEIGKAYREARGFIEKKHSFDKRALIAKPIIAKGEKPIDGRHAKPYFLHVVKLPNNKFRGHILFMPYNYYEQENREEYFETCAKMNQKLSKLSGGTK